MPVPCSVYGGTLFEHAGVPTVVALGTNTYTVTYTVVSGSGRVVLGEPLVGVNHKKNKQT